MRRIGILAGVLVLSGGVWACIGTLLDSVHFNDGTPDFGSPPPPIVLTVWGETEDRAGNTQNGPNEPFREDYDAKEKAEKAEQDRIKGILKDGVAKEESGDYEGAIASYQTVLRSGKAPDAESLTDRIEVMRESKTMAGSPKAYLAARRALSDLMTAETPDKAAIAQGVKSFLAMGVPNDSGYIGDHALYVVAGADYDDGRYEDALNHYRAISSGVKGRKERAMIMEARILLMGGAVPDGKSWEDAKNPTPERVTAASKVLDRLDAQFPGGRYSGDARGLRARILFLNKQYAAAMSAYLRILAATDSPEKQARVLASIRAVSAKLSPAAAKEVQAAIVKDPALLQPYLDYRLYHTSAKPADLANLVDFAKSVSANSGARLSAGVDARLAEINLLRHDYASALTWADRSLAAEGGANARRDLATYVRAGCVAKTDAAAAIAGYRKVAEMSDSYLHQAARENLAILLEHGGRWGEALDQYEKLGYTYDIAYLLDARMSTDEIRQLIDKRGTADLKHNLLKFSLAMRLMRDDKLDEARSLLASIPTAERDKLSHKGSGDYSWVEDKKGGILDSLFDPLDTANDLIALRKKVASASTDSGRADALYALASYYYTHRNLLLYNASLWDGGRNWAFGASWNTKIATHEDNVAAQNHHYVHESVNRARLICLEVVKRYPKSAAAPKALYRAATATRRLASFNGWWRNQKAMPHLYADAAALLDRVAKEYPADALAKKARKYAQVFREEGKGNDQQLLFTAEK